MKYLKSILTIAVAISFVTINYGQGQYESGMQKALELWSEGKNVEAVALFERIDKAEIAQWLPAYYAANVLIVQSFMAGDSNEKMLNLEKAKTFMATAHDKSPDNSEIYTLEGLLYTGYVAMDPAVYAMQYSEKIMQLHGKAVELDSNNPRANSNMIEYEMGGAKFFKQDLKPYCDRLEKVLPLYDAQNSNIPFYPSYGKERIAEMISTCGQ